MNTPRKEPIRLVAQEIQVFVFSETPVIISQPRATIAEAEASDDLLKFLLTNLVVGSQIKIVDVDRGEVRIITAGKDMRCTVVSSNHGKRLEFMRLLGAISVEGTFTMVAP